MGVLVLSFDAPRLALLRQPLPGRAGQVILEAEESRNHHFRLHRDANRLGARSRGLNIKKFLTGSP